MSHVAPAVPTSDSEVDQVKQIRGSAILLIGTLLASGVDFFGQVLLVRYLTKDAFGAWSYALAVVVLFSGVAQYEMRNAISRFVPIYLERHDWGKLLGAVALALGVAAGVGLGIVAVIEIAIGVMGFRPIEDPTALRLLLLTAVLIPIQAVDSVFTGLFAAFGASRTILVRQSLLAPGLRLALVIGLMVVGAGVEMLAFGYTAVGIVGVLLYLFALKWLLRDRGIQPFGGKQWQVPARELLGFATPLLSTTLVWLLMESSDAVLLGYFFDSTAVAQFRAVLPLARLNGIVAMAFAILYLPLAARLRERGDVGGLRDLYWRTALWMTVLTLPIMILTTSFAHATTVGFFGPAYGSSSGILVLLAVGYFINTAAGFNGLTVKIHGRLRYSVTIDITAAVANVGLSLVLVPRFGPIGAAAGTAATLVLHNVFKQLGLARYTAVGAFDRRYAVPYAEVVVIAVGAALLAAVVPSNLVIAILVAGIAGLLALWLTRAHLDVLGFFPEVRLLPLPRWLKSWIGVDPRR